MTFSDAVQAMLLSGLEMSSVEGKLESEPFRISEELNGKFLVEVAMPGQHTLDGRCLRQRVSTLQEAVAVVVVTYHPGSG